MEDTKGPTTNLLERRLDKTSWMTGLAEEEIINTS